MQYLIQPGSCGSLSLQLISITRSSVFPPHLPLCPQGCFTVSFCTQWKGRIWWDRVMLDAVTLDSHVCRTIASVGCFKLYESTLWSLVTFWAQSEFMEAEREKWTLSKQPAIAGYTSSSSITGRTMADNHVLVVSLGESGICGNQRDIFHSLKKLWNFELPLKPETSFSIAINT